MRFLAFVLLVLLGGLSLAGAPPGVAAQTPTGGLILRTEIFYDLRPEERSVRVQIRAQIENRDPQTPRRASGQVSFYDRVILAVHKNGENVRARGPSGTALVVEPVPATSPVWQWVYVKFDRNLFYTETYALQLEYDIIAANSPTAIVSDGYTSLLITGQGAESIIKVQAPSAAAYATTMGTPSCQREETARGPLFTCRGNANFVTWVDVIRPTARQSLDGRVTVGERTITLRLTYFRDEEQWARNTFTLLQRALPLLREANGHPYRGPDPLEAIESGAVETEGYAGRFGSAIRVSSRASPSAIIHEAAHAWSYIYGVRWLQEAFAQYTTNITTAHLGVQGENRPWPVASPPPDQPPLDDWGAPPSLLTSEEAVSRRELYFYAKALAFLNELERQVGGEALRATNANIARSGRAVDSRGYMDFIEETTGQNLDALFLEWVFGEGKRPLIEQRRQVRNRLKEMRTALAALGLPVPLAIQQAVEAWNFSAALTEMAQVEYLLPRLIALQQRMREHYLAGGDRFRLLFQSNTSLAGAMDYLSAQERAVDAIVTAEREVNRDHSLTTRIGLLGRHPGRLLDQAKDALAHDDPAKAEQLALHAVESQRRAVHDGQRRVVVGATALLLTIAVLGFGGMSLRTSRHWGATARARAAWSPQGRQASVHPRDEPR